MLLYPIDLINFKNRVAHSKDRYKLCGNLRYNNADLVFPFNKQLKYTPKWIFAPVVDLQYMLALNNEGLNITKVFSNWFNDLKQKGFYDNGLLLHNFYQPFYRLDPGWASGMAQGLLLSCILRCDRNEVSDHDVEMVAKSMLSGPLVSDTQFGAFIEEYPHSNPNMVLNGFLFSLIGLFECLVCSHPDKYNAEIRIRSLEYLETFIAAHKFYLTSSFNSRYDIQGRLADEPYHLLHIEQLLAVNTLAEQIFGISINYIVDQFKRKPVQGDTLKKGITVRKFMNLYCILRFKYKP